MQRRPPITTRTAPLFPYTTLFRSKTLNRKASASARPAMSVLDGFPCEPSAAFAMNSLLASLRTALHEGRAPAQADCFPALIDALVFKLDNTGVRSEEHTSELQALMRISYAVFCLKKQTTVYI